MIDFSSMFTETLSLTITKMVEEAISAKNTQIDDLKARVDNLYQLTLTQRDELSKLYHDANVYDGRINDAITEIERLAGIVDNLPDVDDQIDMAIKNFDFGDVLSDNNAFDIKIEECISNYDFSDIISDNMQTENYESREFADAVKDVVARALQ